MPLSCCLRQHLCIVPSPSPENRKIARQIMVILESRVSTALWVMSLNHNSLRFIAGTSRASLWLESFTAVNKSGLPPLNYAENLLETKGLPLHGSAI